MDGSEERQHRESPTKLEYLLICDIEATCTASNRNERPSSSESATDMSLSGLETDAWEHEIIEFPIVLFSIGENKVLSEFRTYIRPLKNPKLSDFCRALTGISQETVDSAQIFTEALREIEAWLLKETTGIFEPPLLDDTKLSILHPQKQSKRAYTNSRNPYKDSRQFKGPRYRRRNWAFCTDGRSDLESFICLQLSLSQFPSFPPYFLGPYVDSRALFSWYSDAKSRKGGRKIIDQLAYFDLRFEGQEHSGLDDTRNIARIVQQMIKKGWVVECNRYMEEVECGWTGDWSRKQRASREAEIKKGRPARRVDELD